MKRLLVKTDRGKSKSKEKRFDQIEFNLPRAEIEFDRVYLMNPFRVSADKVYKIESVNVRTWDPSVDFNKRNKSESIIVCTNSACTMYEMYITISCCVLVLLLCTLYVQLITRYYTIHVVVIVVDYLLINLIRFSFRILPICNIDFSFRLHL